MKDKSAPWVRNNVWMVRPLTGIVTELPANSQSRSSKLYPEFIPLVVNRLGVESSGGKKASVSRCADVRLFKILNS